MIWFKTSVSQEMMKWQHILSRTHNKIKKILIPLHLQQLRALMETI